MADTETPPVRVVPTFPISLQSLYTLYYRHGTNPYCFKTFYHAGDLQSAVNRGRTHCDTMGFVYNIVVPFIADLERAETKKSEHASSRTTANKPIGF